MTISRRQSSHSCRVPPPSSGFDTSLCIFTWTRHRQTHTHMSWTAKEAKVRAGGNQEKGVVLNVYYSTAKLPVYDVSLITSTTNNCETYTDKNTTRSSLKLFHCFILFCNGMPRQFGSSSRYSLGANARTVDAQKLMIPLVLFRVHHVWSPTQPIVDEKPKKIVVLTSNHLAQD